MSRRKGTSPTKKAAPEPSPEISLSGVMLITVIVGVSMQMLAHFWADARAGRLICAQAKSPPPGVHCHVADAADPQCNELVKLVVDLQWIEKKEILDACWRPDPIGTVMDWRNQPRPQDKKPPETEPAQEDPVGTLALNE